MLDPFLEMELMELSAAGQAKYLFLEDHREYRNYFKVNCFDPFFLKEFEDVVGEFQAISIWKLAALSDRIKERGYQLIFMNDPTPFFEWMNTLNDDYPLELGFELKEFQIQGFNYLKDRRAGVVEWSTGTGKSVYGCARAKYLLATDKVDKVVVVAKSHNKINWMRQLKKVADIDAAVIGFRWKERKALGESGRRVEPVAAMAPAKLVAVSGNATEKRAFRSTQYQDEQVFVINYEKLRDDTAELIAALKKQRVYFIWDEMPTKLKTRRTQVNRATRQVVKACGETYQDMLTATPVENSPEDVYNCIKILDPDALDRTVMDFRNRYAQSWSAYDRFKVATWNTTALRELGMRLAHMTHKASKYTDPEIAAQFPVEHWEEIIIEMSPEDRKLYDHALDKIISDFWDPSFTPMNILQRMSVLQLICNNPYTINLAGGKFSWAIKTKNPPTDRYCNKLVALREHLDIIPGKVVIFSALNNLGAKPLTLYVGDWGYEHVLFDGNATQKQAAIDRFMTDPDCKAFISSDQGSDSIDLNAGSTVINYDLPWKYSTKIQRVNRVNRITSLGMGIENVYYSDYIMENTIEERKRIILERKKAYADAIGSEITEQMEAISTLTKNDLWFTLTGEDRG